MSMTVGRHVRGGAMLVGLASAAVRAVLAVVVILIVMVGQLVIAAVGELLVARGLLVVGVDGLEVLRVKGVSRRFVVVARRVVGGRVARRLLGRLRVAVVVARGGVAAGVAGR